tara:strand:+ start:1108 stop:1266 length:159 start_codon:yes stop_codon:yes gene_type:complete
MNNTEWPMTQPSNIRRSGNCGCGEDFVYEIDGKFGARSWVCFTCGYAERGSE